MRRDPLLRHEVCKADPCGNDHVECERALGDSTGSRRPAALCQNDGVDGGELPASLLAEVTELAVALVDAGRFVPGMSVVDGTGIRSWWWPLPAASDRAALRALLPGTDAASHAIIADTLAVAVDQQVRARVAGADLVPRRPGRRTLPEAWITALGKESPWLEGSFDPDRARDFEQSVVEWVRSGRVAVGRLQLCLRIQEPVDVDGLALPWVVEVLIEDVNEPGSRIPLEAWWAGAATVDAEAGRALLADLARMTRVAPELAGLLDEAVPARVDLDEATVTLLLTDRVGPLTDSGVTVLLPSWWTGRRRLGLRAKATTRKASRSGAVVTEGFGLDELVDFRWEAALGEQRLTKADLQTLEAAAAARRSLVRLRGQWVEVRGSDVDGVMARVGRSQRASAAALLRMSVGIPVASALGDNLGDIPVHGVTATGWLGQLLDQAQHARVQPIPKPPGFNGTLREYQARGVGWLAFLGRLGLGACLADDMGLGKTAQLIGSLLIDPLPEPTVVVCPVSVLGNWQRELATFAPGLRVMIHHGPDRDVDQLPGAVARYDVVLTTYSLVARDIDVLSGIEWGRLVLDEAQQVKNSGTAQAQAVRRLRAGRRVALTGTPVENRLSELWSIMQVVSPGLLGSSREFRERFAVPIERDADQAATQQLRRITGPFVLRRLKSDPGIADELPAKIERTEHCRLSREQATLYKAVVDDLLERVDESEGIDRRGAVLAGLTKLKQVCNHPALLLGDDSALPGRSGKLNRIEELLEEIVDSGDRVLAFTQYATWGDLLTPYLSERLNIEALWLHGGVPRKQRDSMVAQFQSEAGPPLMLISLRAGGTGLNLTKASHVIHLDRWWNPAVEDQATDRAHRIGQARSVFVHRLVTTGTVEERIDEMITRKRDLAQRVVGSGESWLTELSTDDLREIVTLRADAVDA